jgi:hypothetical protein
MSRTLLPVDEPYTARVLVGYLAEAFNPRFARGVDVPPAENPLWPIACRMVQAMDRDHYRLAALAVDGRYTSRAADQPVTVLRTRM